MRLLSILVLFSGLAAATAAPAQVQSEAIERVRIGDRSSEGVPELPADLLARLQRYQNTRAASFAGWLDDGLLISTRFSETNQVHRVRAPMAAREQLSFMHEPVMAPASAPAGAPAFAYLMDIGGSEFWQLYLYDLASREVRLLSDGRSRNERPLWSNAGDRIAYSTTRRSGRDSDIHIVDRSGNSTPVLEREGAWYAAAWSPDDRRLLVIRYLSVNHVQPHLLDLDSGDLTALHTSDDPAGYGNLAFSPDGRGYYYTSDEDSEFRQLRHRDFDGGQTRILSGHLPWDVRAFEISRDGRHLAYVANEDGLGTLHLLRLPDETELAVPDLPPGMVMPGGFSPDGGRLAVTINGAASPSDVYVVDVADNRLVRWTQSEVGGLDASRFVEPSLIRYPTFDQVDGATRTIPAFYYRPPGDGPFPVVVNIHGGPEAQALPVFSPNFQFLVRELGIAVLVPNVRGSAGYGKTYLQLDNGRLREDSVRDIGALLDWVQTRPELDAERIGVAGGSYGGYMVLASMVHYNNRLRAGINVVGISNFVTFLENTESYRRDLRRAEYGDERDPDMRTFLESISPLSHADKITRPLFVAQGTNDPRVPVSEAEQIVRKVRGNGGEVWYLLFHDEGHGFAKKRNRDHYEASAMLFWQTHLLDRDED